jgi:hypothetical protein
MIGKSSLRILLLTMIAFGLPRPGAAQATFDRTNFEVGVVYTDDILFGINPCAADDFRYFLQWGDDIDNSTEALRGLNSTFPLPDKTKDIFVGRRHSYAAQGSYKIILTNIYHCYGSGDPSIAVTNTTITLTAYPRGTVGALRTDHRQYKPGEMVQLTVSEPGDTKTSPAGTRVYLNVVQGVKAIDPSTPIPTFVDIPSGQSQVQITFRAGTPPTSPMRVRITGTASNTQSVNFTVGG